jgi:integrase
VAELRPADVRRLIRECLDGGLSASSAQRVVAVLRVALGQAVEDGELPANVAKVKLPRVERERVEAMTPETAERILNAVRYRKDDDGAEHGSRILEPVVTLLLGCGLRLGEACALDWRDLRLPKPGKPPTGEESVTVRLGKTHSSRRSVPLPGFVTVSLLAHRARSPRVGEHEPVFLGAHGERLRPDYVSHAFPKLLLASGLPRLSAHKLRHGTATLLVARGVPLPIVASILGHADPSMTVQVYAHVAPDSKRAAMAEMDALRQPSTRD